MALPIPCCQPHSFPPLPPASFRELYPLVSSPYFRFSVNLLCQNGDVAFHFNPRFDEGRVVVCNTMQQGRWGTEERTFNMTFQAGVYFEMIIHVQAQCYQVGPEKGTLRLDDRGT